MPTAKGGYYLANGDRVPSVTTVIGRFKNAGPLMWWAWDCGMKGIDYRDAAQRAADAGTLAHAAVEAWVRGRSFVFEGEPEVCERAETAFGAFIEWSRQTQLRVTQTEMPLVSEQHRYGGTFDAILVGNQRAMADWKSSAAVYPEYLVQIAAYGELWRENFPNEPIEGGYHLIRFDKMYGDFKHHFWRELNSAWRAFLILRELYDIEKELKARSK